MLTLTLAAALTVLPAADPPDKGTGQTTRKPHPFAPSLPELSDEEEEKFDRIVDRFILADTGKLRGPEAKAALQEFQKLPPEAVFALIRGLNKSAKIDHSCPAVTIAKRLATQIRSTTDRDLLDYARENIGLGVEKSKHMGVIKELKLACTLRKSALGKTKNVELRAAPGRP